MNEEQKLFLEQKRKQLQFQLEVNAAVYREIEFHWLDYFNSINKLQLPYSIEYLCAVTENEKPFYDKAIQNLQNPFLTEELVTINNQSLHDKFFAAFPSTSLFKYVIDLTVLNSSNENAQEILLAAQKQLNFNDKEVYFFSTDCLPLLKLQWKDLLKHGNEIFNHANTSLVFTNISNSWIIFRSIENEWRYGFWKS